MGWEVGGINLDRLLSNERRSAVPVVRMDKLAAAWMFPPELEPMHW